MTPDAEPACTHTDQVEDVAPSAEGCQECLEAGDEWVEARMCLVCGHVGCRDSSENQHARKHFQATGHPLIEAFEPGADWRWCYLDEVYLEPS